MHLVFVEILRMFTRIFLILHTPNAKDMRSKNFHWAILITLMGLFSVTLNSCSDDESEPEVTTVTDIDGNEYHVVTIGFYEWTVENLRVSRYNNGDPIPSGLSDDDWTNTTEGAYAIFDHNHPWADGIDSPEEMVEAYGKIYNWYAVDDPRGLCPEGWHVPSLYAWESSVSSASGQGYPNDFMDPDNPNGVANALRSCLQVGSPLGEECATLLHPRWKSHEVHHGFDAFDFAALPAGFRSHGSGSFLSIGQLAHWLTSTQSDLHYPEVYVITISSDVGNVRVGWRPKITGGSIRCVREVGP